MMVNPFDKTFFRFILGFAFILSLSFGVLFFAGRYQSSLATNATADNIQAK